MKHILYGNKKRCNDFKYIFESFNIEETINEEDNDILGLINIIKLKDINDYHVILCTENPVIMEQCLKKESIEFSRAENYFKELDNGYYRDIEKKIIGIWGTGGTTDNFLNKHSDVSNKIKVDFYVDSDESKWGTMYRGIEIINPKDIDKFSEKVFIIVAVMAYDEVRYRLINMGFQENTDFILYTYWGMQPSHMFQKTYYAESMIGPSCSKPFEYSQIMWNGHYCCCPEWVSIPIGNPYTDTPDKAWNSIVAKIFRLSILNNTYSFCDLNKCPIPKEKKIVQANNIYATQVPKELNISIDDSCNLRCKSCRTKIRVLNNWEKDQRRNIVDKIIESAWMQKVDMLIIGGNGEVFASELYQELLFHPLQKERDCINILTNGNLFTKEKIDKLKDIYRHINISISIDAATEETYEKIRRGGSWKKLNENLQLLSNEKDIGGIDRIQLNMVVQRENYKEMLLFIKLARFYNFDSINFSRILNWGTFSENEYERISMVDKNGKVSDELKEILGNPIFNENDIDANELMKLL